MFDIVKKKKKKKIQNFSKDFLGESGKESIY